jgi:3-phosphoshikimate 1-carboxyvinyltransferase
MRVDGEVRVPADKSISHRALLCAAVATGRSRVRRLLQSADVRSTAGVLRALGVALPPLSDDVAITGRGLRGLRAPGFDLDCGNSGTTVRLAAGIAAGHPFASRFVGDDSLSRRPMRRVARPLTAMGATVELEHGDGLPMTVRGGALAPIDWTTESASAQVKSAILLAGLVGGVPVSVTEPAASRDHTERMLRRLGAPVRIAGTTVRLEPVARIHSLDLTVPGDPSSAAFFVALASLATSGELVLRDVCLNDTRVGFLRAMERMGARVTVEAAAEQGGEPVGSLRVGPAPLAAIEVVGSDVPAMIDELPILACVAARAAGTTVITGAAELRVKESDRITTMVSNLRALGADAEELPDGLRVTGRDAPLRGQIRTGGDHRVAMAFAVLGALPGNQIEIDDPTCVEVSYPGFWTDLRRVVPN